MLRSHRRLPSPRIAALPHQPRRQVLRVEELETRVVPSSTRLDGLFARPHVASPFVTLASAPFSPSQIRHAYGIDQITFGSVRGDGTGQTIAIIDAYNAPHIRSDLAAFDSSFGLPAPASFKIINQNGGTRLPRNNSGWALETSLDVEWAHATAPNASILLVEANSSSFSNLFTAVATAAKQTGVSVVSMSFGGGEFSSETNYDSVFTTPSGHQGVSFVASAGDSGAPAQYPSASPNVLSIGGTSLAIDTAGNYVSEVGWSNSSGATGGGPSSFEPEPSYQSGAQSTGSRGTPDVALVADPNTGVYVYDSYGYSGWLQVGGTSLSAPVWAGLVAIANQGRAINHAGSLSNLPADVYALPAADFHDITSGNNGYAAGPGYDFVTGLGTPLANVVVPALASATLPNTALRHAPVHKSVAVKPPPVSPKTPPDAITLFIAAGPSTGLTIAGTGTAITASNSPSALARDTALAQLPLRMAALAPSMPASAASRVALSEPTLELAHTLPDGQNVLDMYDPSSLPDGSIEALAMPSSGRLPAFLARTSLPGVETSTIAALEERDSFFAHQAEGSIIAGPVLIADTAEGVKDSLSPVAIAGLAMILGGSWRSAPEEQEKRPALRV